MTETPGVKDPQDIRFLLANLIFKGESLEDIEHKLPSEAASTLRTLAEQVLGKNDIYRLSVAELDICPRVLRALQDSRIFYIGQLVERTELGLKKTVWNLGKKGTREVKQALVKRGLSLNDEGTSHRGRKRVMRKKTGTDG